MLVLTIGTLLLVGSLIALANHSSQTRSVAQILRDLDHPGAGGR
jgi:hypothetical protein